MVSKNKNSSVSPKFSGPNQKKNNNNRNRKPTSTLRTMDFSSPAFPQQRGSDTGPRRFNRINKHPISKDGMAFLKCAFAPPDFQASTIGGIPDDFRGPSLTKKHRLVMSQEHNSAYDYYYILAPVPGIAYYMAYLISGTSPSSSMTWGAIPYGDFDSTFGTSAYTTSQNMTRFRFVSNHFEIVPTVNQMNWSGSIQAWKLPLQFITRPPAATSIDTDLFSITGLDGVGSTQANMYCAPFNMGIYTGCYSSNPDFLFTNLTEDIAGGLVPESIGPSDWGQFNGLGKPFTGFDNGFESMLIKVSGISSPNQNSCIIKTWACVEYQVSPQSTLYSFISLSPMDMYAINLYREIINNLPVGVPYMDNEGFWSRVLGIINSITGATSMIPGPIGVASRGLNLLGQASAYLVD